MAVVKSIGELDAKEYNALNATLMQSGYCVVENGDEVNLVSLSDLTNFMGHYKEYSQLETSNKELIAAINELYAYVYNYVWIGTTEEYEALPEYEDMFYLVTDGGANYDSVLNNDYADSVVDLETETDEISDYKMYKATKLETVKGLLLNAIGQYTFAGDSALYSIEVSNDPLNLNQQSFADSPRLYKLIRDKYEYVGSVTSIPFSSVRVMDNPHGGNIVYTDVSDYEFRDGHLVFNEADSKTYVYNGSSWEVFIPDKNTRVGPSVFAGCSNFACFPYKLKGCNPPTTAQASYNGMFRGSSVRNLYIEADDFDQYEREHMTTYMFYQNTALERVWMIHNGALSDDFSLVFPVMRDYCFNLCANLKAITLTNTTSLGNYSLAGTGLTEIIAPKVTSIATGSVRQNSNLVEVVLGAITGFANYLASDNPKLEKFTFGNGTNTPSSSNLATMFQNCPNLWYFKMDTVAVVPLTGNILNTFRNTALINFLGTTTTAISEGSTTTSVVIGGTTKTAANNNIVTYDGKDWVLVSGAWTEWGTDGDKHPVIKVPNSLISTYQSHTQWSNFSPEIWSAI